MEGLIIIVLVLIFLFITLGQQLSVILKAKTRSEFRVISDDKTMDLIKDKAGVSIKKICIVQSEKPYGLMVGIPARPILILSSNLYETFTKDELEYVFLHEAAHYKYLHSVREVIFSILLIFVGIIVVFALPVQAFSFVITVMLGVILGIINVQFAYLSELQADRFAIRNMSNPPALITAIEKFKEAWNGRGSRSTFLGILFQRGTSYKRRIQMAEIGSRQGNYKVSGTNVL